MRITARGFSAAFLATALLGGCEPLPPSQATSTSELRSFICPPRAVLFGVRCTPGLEVVAPDCEGGLCADLESAGCVDCGTACVRGSICPVSPSLGCPVGFDECAQGICRDLQTDRLNCGVCGLACALGEVCSDGLCELVAGAGCPVGFEECTLGNCRNLQSDRLNCGACGLACGVGEVCSSGFCRSSAEVCPGDPGCSNSTVVACPFGFLQGGCGTCGIFCESGSACVDGECVVECEAGTSRCGDSCVDLLADERNCGECGLVCEIDTACVDGACVEGCLGGLTRCGGVCVDLLSDETSCGRCGRSCPAGSVCISGTCL